MPVGSGTINIHWRGEPALARALDKIPEAHGILIGGLVGKVHTHAVTYAKPHGADTGEIAGSIEKLCKGEPVPYQAKVWTSHTGAGAAELGRRAGAMPPPTYLFPWALAHGVPPGAVQRTIARKGTKGRKFMAKAVKEAKRVDVPQLLRAAEAKLMGAWL